MSDNEIRNTGEVIVEYVSSKKGFDRKNNRPYTQYSLLVYPWRGADHVPGDDEKYWLSSGFRRPAVNKGDLVTINYEVTNSEKNWTSILDVEHVNTADTTDEEINND